MNPTEAAEALSALQHGQRRALARALSRAESQLPEDRRWLDALWAARQPADRASLRVALTGPPGAGKSTLLEALGSRLLGLGARVAVLPVDPSSPKSGGSLLADATRMPQLSSDPRAFVRPSAARRMLGGLAVHTLESIELCELAGYDWIFVETVGVGQSEDDAALVSDLVMLVVPPSGGDEIQALKRGINESCDLVVVNKDDGVDRAAVARVVQSYESTLGLLRRKPASVFRVSAREGKGVEELTAWLCERQRAALSDSSALCTRRRQQRCQYFERVLQQTLLSRLLERPLFAARYAELRAEVEAGALGAGAALSRLLSAI